jgi:hypothetical protein
MIAYAFPSSAEAAAARDAVDAQLRLLAAARGFVVNPDGTAQGRNAATGMANPDAVTATWSSILAFDDGTFGFPSLRVTLPTMHLSVEAAAGLSAPTERGLFPVDSGQ